MKNVREFLFATSVGFLLTVTPAFADDPVIGMWKTEPDRKNLVSFIKIRQCGVKLCGRIIKAFDPTGKEVKTKNIGKELFWDIEPAGGGIYVNGVVQVPLLNITAKAGMQLQGGKLHVKGCKAGLCNGQTWTRL